MNMRLMKSSFGHQYMVMGGWGTALYPLDESMRYRGVLSGGRLTHAEMAQKVRLERCIGGRLQPGTKSGEGCPTKDPRLCEKGPPLTMDPWGAGGHHPPGVSYRHPPEELCHRP